MGDFQKSSCGLCRKRLPGTARREEEEEEVEIVGERQLPPQGAILVTTEERGEKKCYPRHHFTRQPLTRGIGSGKLHSCYMLLVYDKLSMERC